MEQMNDEVISCDSSISAQEELKEVSNDLEMEFWIGPSEADQQDYDEYCLSRQLEEDFFFPDIPDNECF